MKPSSFTVMLAVTVMSVIGIASLPLLKIQYKPTNSGRTMSVSFLYPGASAEIVEAEVTSKVEGIMARLSGSTETSSSSHDGYGTASVTLDRKTDMDEARLELSSLLRNLYHDLPEGVSYPDISHDIRGEQASVSMAYCLNSRLPTLTIEQFARDHIVPALSDIEGIEDVSLHGSTPRQLTVTFDAAKAAATGISGTDIAAALEKDFSESIIGMSDVNRIPTSIRLAYDNQGDIGNIPLGRSGEKIVYLRDLATWQVEESLPRTYFRVNGLNSVSLSITVSPDANLLLVCKKVRKEMAQFESHSPEDISASIAYDSSEYISSELNKIYFRTALCTLLLLLSVLVAVRSWKQMIVVAISLLANILSALAVYAFAGIAIHIYTLAGLTVSLGIIIDTYIVAIDHYARYHDRKSFPSLIAATSTTVVALLLTLLLPESETANLKDFVWVIAINTVISLAICWFFIPALSDSLRISNGTYSSVTAKAHIRILSVYGKYIAWGTRHRWLYPVMIVIPTLLAFWIFNERIENQDFYRETIQPVLYVSAAMPDGCTIHQLNEVVKPMEDYLMGFGQIEVFTTNITSHDNATISIQFKPEYEYGAFPQLLKSLVSSLAMDLGGASWSVRGLDMIAFSNNVTTDYKMHRIGLEGYNYRELMSYAEYLEEYLSRNRRVYGAEIRGAGWGDRPKTELSMAYDFEAMSTVGISPYDFHSNLSSLLYERTISGILPDTGISSVVLKSSERDQFDYWHVLNSPQMDPDAPYALKDIGDVVLGQSGVSITKSRQTYNVNICFNFIGDHDLATETIEEAVEHMNADILPLGYKASNPNEGWWDNNKDKYAWLVLLIVAAVYLMLAIAFESLVYPLAVIAMIPVSFIGAFLTFGLFNLPFDQGGFAAFVMLCCLVVNAGIYLIMAFGNLLHSRQNPHGNQLKMYLKAFSIKIRPIMLTVASTILAMIPFLSSGSKEAFWFDFAAGTIGGMFFSLIALVLVLPVFVVRK